MNYIQQLFSEELQYALGWTMIHSLWQGFLLALLMAMVLLGLHKHSARLRYAIANVTLLLALLWSVFTFFDLYRFAEENVLREIILTGTVAETGNSHYLHSIYQTFIQYFNQHLPLIVAVWLSGVAFFMLRMMGGLAYIRRLKNRHNRALSESWQLKLHKLAVKIPVKKPVRLLESALVKVPMVVGYLKPVILMPVGAVNGLTQVQVEAILAHELAHIYRNDYLLNILQSFVETLFYFNPAIWWISTNIRSERENCCDDIAVKLCGDSLTYAKALVSLQEVHPAAPALAMPFAKSKSHLLNRVKRILQQPKNRSNIMEKFTATLLLVVAIIMLSFGANAPLYKLFGKKKEGEKITVNVEIRDVLKDGQPKTATVQIVRDTVPKDKKKGKRKTYIRKQKNKSMEMTIENGEVKNLVIDGEEIPAEKYGDYEDEMDELKEELSGAPAPPAPPVPPSVGSIPVPPTPPSAPSAPKIFKFKSRKITTEKDGNGNTKIIIEENSGNDPVEIQIEEGDDGSIIINGEKIEGLGEGESAVLLEELADENPGIFSWNGTAPFVWKDKSTKYYNKDLKSLHKDLKRFRGKLAIPNYSFPDGLAYGFNGDNGLNFFYWGDDSEEEQAKKEGFLEEFQERLRDGNLSEEWLEKWSEEFQKGENSKFWTPPAEKFFFRFQDGQEKLFERQNRLRLENRVPLEELQYNLNEHDLHVPEPRETYNDALHPLLFSPEPSAESGFVFPEFGLFDSDFGERIERELREDGFIKKEGHYTFDLNDKRLKINGEKQPDAVFKKYKKLYEEHLGQPFGKTRIEYKL